MVYQLMASIVVVKYMINVTNRLIAYHIWNILCLMYGNVIVANRYVPSIMENGVGHNRVQHVYVIVI